MSSSLPTAQLLLSRFHDLLLSYDFARRQRALQLGEEDETLQDTDEQRHLLDVERTAKENRDIEAFGKEVNKQEASIDLNKEIEANFIEQLNDIEHIAEDIVGITDSVPAVLDILSVKAASIGRIEPLVASQIWLSQDIIKFVNLPAYRPSDKSKNIRVEKLHTALSYVGLENLPFVLPSFSLRQWLPHSTEPFRLMKRKLWESGLGAAICCKKLAQIHGENEPALFTAGMFHDIGKSAIVRLYLRTFDEIWKAKLIKARDDREKDYHDALVDLEPDPTTLRKLMIEHSASLSAKLVEQFNLKRLIILPTMEEFAGDYHYNDISTPAQLLRKGVAFSRYKMLQKHNLVSKDEAKAFFKAHNISTEEVLELRKLSLKRLNLRMQS